METFWKSLLGTPGIRRGRRSRLADSPYETLFSLLNLVPRSKTMRACPGQMMFRRPPSLSYSAHCTVRLSLGVAKDHAKDWWTQGEESRGRPIAALFVYFPILVAIAIFVTSIWTGNWSWLIALPLGFLTMLFGSPMNPAKGMAVLFAAALLLAGWALGWSSLIASGLVVLAIYIELQVYYGLGKRAFRRFLISNSEGFARYWMAGIVMLQDPATGYVHRHENVEERLSALGLPALADV